MDTSKHPLQEDADIKIADGSFEPVADADSVEGEETARELQREKENGNLNRARRLGAIMADGVSAIEGDSPAGDGVLMTQRRILLAFAVEMGLKRYLNDLLAETAQSVFYDTLRETAPAFFEDLQESNAFSFYYLCVREGGGVEKKVGDTFAALCGLGGNEACARTGEELYGRFIEQVRHYSEVLAFVSAEESGA